MTSYCLHPSSIRDLFDSVAPRYDFLNHLLSFGRDRFWRKTAARELRGLEGWILDVATGTADLAIEMLRQNGRENRVWGLDVSEPMIRRGWQKIRKKRLTPFIALARGDALKLPFRDSTFSASMIAFGLRNILDKESALLEMIRVTRRGGKVVILEFTLPRGPVMKRLYPLYFRRFLPWLGGWISGDRGAYAYLPDSVIPFPHAEDYVGLLKRSGLKEIRFTELTFGIVSIIAGNKEL